MFRVICSMFVSCARAFLKRLRWGPPTWRDWPREFGRAKMRLPPIGGPNGVSSQNCRTKNCATWSAEGARRWGAPKVGPANRLMNRAVMVAALEGRKELWDIAIIGGGA